VFRISWSIYTIYTYMLTVIDSTGEYNTTVKIQGPAGVIEIRDLVWCPSDRQDLLEIYYWESWAVLQGAYHCCFSLPGKVSLLQE
jgi:hypothetical protein